MNILFVCTPAINIRGWRKTSLPCSKHQVLHAQVHVAHALEDGAEFESGRNNILRVEQIAHFHHIAEKPGAEDRDTKSSARTRALVCKDLWDGEKRFDGESSNPEEVGICLCFRDERKEDVSQN